MVFGSFEALAECVDSNYHNCQGAITYSDGTLYVGEFKDGLPNGQGTFTYASGTQYVGEWMDGKNNGQGTKTFADGSQYVGEWMDGKRNGQGALTYTDGRQKIGKWKNDEYQIVMSAADCDEARYRKVNRLGQIYQYNMKEYRSISGLPPHIIENATDDYFEEVRRAEAEYDECKKRSDS